MDTRQRFSELLDHHGGMLWRIVASYELDPELRRDLYQEVLVAVWRALPAHSGQSSEKTYLARVAQNRCITHVSREVRRPGSDPLPESLASPGTSLEDHVGSAMSATRLHVAVTRLPLPLRQVVTLALEDMSPREIAGVLGSSANAISVKLTRAKQALRVLLEEEGS